MRKELRDDTLHLDARVPVEEELVDTGKKDREDETKGPGAGRRRRVGDIGGVYRRADFGVAGVVLGCGRGLGRQSGRVRARIGSRILIEDREIGVPEVPISRQPLYLD